MDTWNVITWNIARSGGLTAYLLLTLAVIIGLVLSLRWQGPWWPRLINSEMHNFLSLLSLIFTLVHLLAIWIDAYTHFSWFEIFVPFASSYHTIWMGLGILAFYLGIAIGISTWLRPRIGYQWWRRFHLLTLLLFVLATLHGIVIGSDSDTTWALFLYATSILLVGGLLAFRLIKAAADSDNVPSTP
ncbi:ferric reductase-like transmembrane domain-containing protein [Ktedonospora formicarum]|uniref:Ferric oxidoreductase domain-containing protein n=1 Tax=Ktedonospora formicarum TaxID=2778364 RepID=A0A8J3HYX7_9CHLR|nr:ferric reductase-like transmembrane domain-containing protein [Ktedonospora formicarum]GHO46304.1 hypothetical protein KSX_44670 [Ktedonospora formicarum]